MQMCPNCDKVYDESEYTHCPYCSGELEDDEEVRPCPECGGCLHWDGELWEAAAMKAGGQSDRYTIMVHGKQS